MLSLSLKTSRRASLRELLIHVVNTIGITHSAYRPDPYLLGAKRCGADPSRCLVVEDAPAGVRSGSAAGCKTLGLLTSHSREQVEAASPTFIVKDLSSVIMKIAENGGVDVIFKAN